MGEVWLIERDSRAEIVFGLCKTGLTLMKMRTGWLTFDGRVGWEAIRLKEWIEQIIVRGDGGG